jgi:hypothetical protein
MRLLSGSDATESWILDAHTVLISEPMIAVPRELMSDPKPRELPDCM